MMKDINTKNYTHDETKIIPICYHNNKKYSTFNTIINKNQVLN